MLRLVEEVKDAVAPEVAGPEEGGAPPVAVGEAGDRLRGAAVEGPHHDALRAAVRVAPGRVECGGRGRAGGVRGRRSLPIGAFADAVAEENVRQMTAQRLSYSAVLENRARGQVGGVGATPGPTARDALDGV